MVFVIWEVLGVIFNCRYIIISAALVPMLSTVKVPYSFVHSFQILPYLLLKGKDKRSPITFWGSQGSDRFLRPPLFSKHSFVTVALISSPSPLQLCLPQRRAVTYSLQLLMQRAELTLTLQVRMLQPVSKDTVHNECGLPMCAVVGLEPRTLEHAQKNDNT